MPHTGEAREHLAFTDEARAARVFHARLGRPTLALIRRVLVAFWVLGLGACAHHPVPTGPVGRTEDEALLNQLWAATGADKLFASLPLQAPIQEMIRDRFKNAGAIYQSKILTLLDEALDPTKLQHMLKSHLLMKFDTAKARDVLSFYSTTLGKSYGKSGHHFNPSDPAFRAFVAGPRPTDLRLERLSKLLTFSGSARLASLTQVTPIETIFSELEHQKELANNNRKKNLANNNRKKNQQAKLRKSMNAVVKAVHQAMLLTASFVYRSLSDQELDILIQFENTQASQWYNHTMLRAYETTLKVAMRRFTRNMLKMLEKEPPPI